jgi:hypothetical protein
MKVSFDFDSTLSRKDVQSFAKDLVDSGHEVWIVTSRFDDKTILERGFIHAKNQNKILFEVADRCGIKRENIKFTNMEPKSDFLKGKGFSFHLDDDEYELMDILESGDSCKPINVGYFDWDSACKEIINS